MSKPLIVTKTKGRSRIKIVYNNTTPNYKPSNYKIVFYYNKFGQLCTRREFNVN